MSKPRHSTLLCEYSEPGLTITFVLDWAFAEVAAVSGMVAGVASAGSGHVHWCIHAVGLRQGPYSERCHHILRWSRRSWPIPARTGLRSQRLLWDPVVHSAPPNLQPAGDFGLGHPPVSDIAVPAPSCRCRTLRPLVE